MSEIEEERERDEMVQAVLPPDGGEQSFWPRLYGDKIEGARDCSRRAVKPASAFRCMAMRLT